MKEKHPSAFEFHREVYDDITHWVDRSGSFVFFRIHDTAHLYWEKPATLEMGTMLLGDFYTDDEAEMHIQEAFIEAFGFDAVFN